MPCPEYDKLKKRLGMRRDEMNYFHPVNAGLHGPAREAKKNFDKAQAESLGLQNAIYWHETYCEACKKTGTT